MGCDYLHMGGGGLLELSRVQNHRFETGMVMVFDIKMILVV